MAALAMRSVSAPHVCLATPRDRSLRGMKVWLHAKDAASFLAHVKLLSAARGPSEARPVGRVLEGSEDVGSLITHGRVRLSQRVADQLKAAVARACETIRRKCSRRVCRKARTTEAESLLRAERQAAARPEPRAAIAAAEAVQLPIAAELPMRSRRTRTVRCMEGRAPAPQPDRVLMASADYASAGESRLPSGRLPTPLLHVRDTHRE